MSERRLGDASAGIKEWFGGSTKALATSHPVALAGTSLECWPCASCPQPPAALCRVSERSAPCASGASFLPAHGRRRAACRGPAPRASAGPSLLLPAGHRSAADGCRAVADPRPCPWPPPSGRVFGPPARGLRGWRAGVAQGHRPSRRTVERYVGRRRRETGPRCKCRPGALAPLDAADHAESRTSPLSALRAARLVLSTPEDRRATEQALLAHLLRLDPVRPRTDHQVQACGRLVRHRHRDDGVSDYVKLPTGDD
jgi:hypothetical protein